MDQLRLLMVGITIMIDFVWNGCLMKLLSMMLSNFGNGYSGALYETARSMVKRDLRVKRTRTHKAEFCWFFLLRQRDELGINVITREPPSSAFQFSVPPST